MVGIDMRGLIDKCNGFCAQALNGAAGMSVSRGHYEVTVEHFMLSCLENMNSDIPLALQDAKADIDRLKTDILNSLEEFKTGNTNRPVFSPSLQELLEAAWLVASVNYSFPKIRSGSVLIAFLRRPSFYAQGSYTAELSKINRDNLEKNFNSIIDRSVEDADIFAQSETAKAKEDASANSDSFIAKFCEDFTAKAEAGKIDPVFGRDAEIRQMVDILARRRKNNPILVGEPGVGKTAVMEGLALRIAQGDVPATLQKNTLLGLDMGLLEAGASVKGEFERRLKGVLDEIKSSVKPIILFIDEAHTLVGAGGTAGGSDAANLMKPALARGEIRTCAATTWKEYKKYFEKDPALARRFQLVKLDEPSVETATLILRGLRDSYEKAHKVLIRDDALVAAADYSARYISGRFLPDKAVDLLDTACARVKVGLIAKPAKLEDMERLIQAKEREQKALLRDQTNGVEIDIECLEDLSTNIENLKEKVCELEKTWQVELEAANNFIELRNIINNATEEEKNSDEHLKNTEEFTKVKATLEELQKNETLINIEVSPDAVAKVVADWTGIPVGKVAREQADLIINLEANLSKRVKGQSKAISSVLQGVQSSKAGLRSPNSPIGVFLLVGPSGVGKTETGLSLADCLFGDERSVVTVNMSEFQERHTVSRLIGSPPGYVGYGEGGLLTEAVRRKPYSVVLLDEVEKAHLDVMQLFYQVFDKGSLTDGEGTEINFKNTLMLLTSNLASDIIQNACLENPNIGDEELIAKIRPVLSQHFQPALLARMTIVPYMSLNSEALKNITELKLKGIADRLFQNNKLKLTWDNEFSQNIADRCTEVETGARNIDYILQGTIMPQLSTKILSMMSTDGEKFNIELSLDEDKNIKIDFS